MAPSRLNALRTALAAAVLVALAWIAYETVVAGNDIPAPSSQGVTQLKGGRASDKRVDGKAWSFDYDTATMSPDGSIADIEGIRHGMILRDGKPYMRVLARHITANLAISDFTVVGPVTFEELSGDRRRLSTDGAHYMGYSHTLELKNRTTITGAGMTLVVDHATVNFDTGATTLGRIDGTL